MLRVVIPATEMWDEVNGVFINTEECTLELEHSLASLSKWEGKWRKPFLTDKEKTLEETVDYVRCMTLSQNVDPDTYNHLTTKNIEDINEYISTSMTAAWFPKNNTKGSSNEQVTSEIIYYQMIALNIPFECENWHLSRLLTLIRVCSEKNKSPKKMSKREQFNQNRSLNAARRARLNSRG
jgi:hypothetical protein